jgi:hypothetical protein
LKRVISHISQWPDLTMRVYKRWEKKPEPFTVTLTGAPKTHKQLGYLHSEVLWKLAQALFDSGEIKSNSEAAAKFWLKMQIGYGSHYTFGETVVFDADSFQRATMETLIHAIDTAIDEAAKRGITIQPPRGKDA